MKKIIVILLLLAAGASALAQDWVDVVYLKNGGRVKGVIIEQIPDKSLKIQTSDGNVFVYQMSEVEKLTKEESAREPQPQRDKYKSYKYDVASLRVSGAHVINDAGTVFTREQITDIMGPEMANRLYDKIIFTSWGAPVFSIVAGGGIGCAVGGAMSKNDTLIAIGAVVGLAGLTGAVFAIKAAFDAEKILDEFRSSAYSIQIAPCALPVLAMESTGFTPGLSLSIRF
ncbi:MAG: hypothetical protein J5737_07340 [Bacteroidales bacterium]|nr:hypothetical protein [Bacteroidales bacterium]